jgi:hypothetical protein
VRSSWPSDAAFIFERACERHGGWERWRHLRKIHLEIADLSGILPAIKGLGRTFPPFRSATIEPHAGRTVFERYPDNASETVFDNGRAGHRQTFRGLRKYRRWSPIDATYFFGYALAHYHSLPFSLAESRLLDHRIRLVSGQRCDALRVELPEDLPAHSRIQTFYFDPSGLLVRHDYVAEIISASARGAHYWLDYADVDGWLVAMRRRVVPRLGDRAFGPAVLKARFARAAVEWAR